MRTRNVVLTVAAVGAIVGLTACSDGKQVLDRDHVVVYDQDGSVSSKEVFDACGGRAVLSQRALNINDDGQTYLVTCAPAR
jgi:phage major head subunit gpT-like protein